MARPGSGPLRTPTAACSTVTTSGIAPSGPSSSSPPRGRGGGPTQTWTGSAIHRISTTLPLPQPNTCARTTATSGSATAGCGQFCPTTTPWSTRNRFTVSHRATLATLRTPPERPDRDSGRSRFTGSQPHSYLVERFLVVRSGVHRRCHRQLRTRLLQPALPLQRTAQRKARVVVRRIVLQYPKERLLRT